MTTQPKQELVQVNADKISKIQGVNYSPEQLAVIKSSVLKGSTDTELAHFAMVASSVGLNPFNKEIWGYKDHQGNLIIFAGRDGFLKKAQESPQYNGIRSAGVYRNDHFVADIPNGVVDHKINGFLDRGELVGAYAIVFRKGAEPTIELATFSQYVRKSPTWNSHPEAMIKKVAETNALKKAFGIAGIQSEYEFNIEDGVAVPVNTTLDHTVVTLTADHQRAMDLCVSEDELEMFADSLPELTNNAHFQAYYEQSLSRIREMEDVQDDVVEPMPVEPQDEAEHAQITKTSNDQPTLL